jgi:hypothetical protein
MVCKEFLSFNPKGKGNSSYAFLLLALKINSTLQVRNPRKTMLFILL